MHQGVGGTWPNHVWRFRQTSARSNTINRSKIIIIRLNKTCTFSTHWNGKRSTTSSTKTRKIINKRERASSRGESGEYTDTSSYQTDVQRSDESPEGPPPPRIAVTQSVRGRTNVPPPPQFYEAIYLAGVRAGAGMHLSQNIQVLSDGDEDDQASTPRKSISHKENQSPKSQEEQTLQNLTKQVKQMKEKLNIMRMSRIILLTQIQIHMKIQQIHKLMLNKQLTEQITIDTHLMVYSRRRVKINPARFYDNKTPVAATETASGASQNQ